MWGRWPRNAIRFLRLEANRVSFEMGRSPTETRFQAVSCRNVGRGRGTGTEVCATAHLQGSFLGERWGETQR